MLMCTRQHISRVLAAFNTTIVSETDQASSRVREGQDFFVSGREESAKDLCHRHRIL